MRGGDHDAFAALMALYERQVRAYLAQLTSDGEQARDLAQEVFLPALSLNDAGYILIPTTGCYALTARWATGSWTLTFQGIV